MAIWPFRRRATGKPSPVRSGEKRTAHGTAVAGSAKGATVMDRQDSAARARRRRKLTRSREIGVGGNEKAIAGTSSTAPGEHSQLAHPRASQSAPDLARTRGAGRSQSGPKEDPTMDYRDDIASYYFVDPKSTTSLASDRRRNRQQRAPTLHAKRDGVESVPRRRSSRRKQDHAREREIKIMSLLERPPRPAATKSDASQKGALDRPDAVSTQPAKRRERPTSEVVIPDPQSMSSPAVNMPGRPEYRVRSLDIFAPRPTLKYSKTLSATDVTEAWSPSRSNSRRGKQPPLHPLAEQAINERKRVAELADGMDASEIRELMERDKRRRDKKQKDDEAKARRRLQRRAEKQSKTDERVAERAVAAIDAGPGPPKPEPDHPSHAVERASDARHPEERVSDSPRLAATDSPLSWLQDPSVEQFNVGGRAETTEKEVAVEQQQQQQQQQQQRQQNPPIDNQEDPVIQTAQAVRLSQASVSPPGSLKQIVRPTSNISHITDTLKERTDNASERTESEARASSSARGSHANAWMSFFRRSANKTPRGSTERGRKTPSEFSNTSRDSLPRQSQSYPRSPPLPSPSGVTSLRTSFQRRSGTPVRTTSKFREELPELPTSPSDSRFQSPITGRALERRGSVAVSPIITDQLPRTHAPAFSPAAAAVSPRSPSSAAPPTSAVSAAKTSMEEAGVAAGIAAAAAAATVGRSRHRSMDAPSVEGKATSAAVSQSMASIGSEGSWLAGKPSQRGSQTQGFPSRHSAGSLRHSQRRSSGSESDLEESAVADDEYFTRLTPGTGLDEGARARTRKPSSTAIASSESEGERESTRLQGGTVVSRQPTTVHNTMRQRSREGLLKTYDDAGDSISSSSPESARSRRFGMSGPGSLGYAGARSVGVAAAVAAAAADIDPMPAKVGSSPISEALQTLETPFETPLETPTDMPSPGTDISPTEVDLGMRQHVRHISAGSARLLEIAPRLSADHRRSVTSTYSGATATETG